MGTLKEMAILGIVIFLITQAAYLGGRYARKSMTVRHTFHGDNKTCEYEIKREFIINSTEIKED